MGKKYRIHLSEAERLELNALVAAGKAALTKRQRAQILLAADEDHPAGAMKDADIARAFGVNLATVERTRCALAEHGLEIAVQGWPAHRKTSRAKVDGWTEAHLVAAACSPPPAGCAQWTLKLLGDHVVGLGLVESLSPSTVGRTLKKNTLKPWQLEQWCLPPEKSAAFVCAMEDVLTVYARPRDPRRPLVCLDEFCKQLIGEARPPLPATLGQAARQDYEYVRHGMCSAFMVYSPLEGRREVRVSGQRTAVQYAETIRWLCDELYPDAEKIVLVQDNLNTHCAASLYEAFAPEEAQRLKERIEWHYTPKHGSWLNMAEIEIGMAQRQCLDRRIADRATVERELEVWAALRNLARATTDWQFTTKDARIKLKRLYPATSLI